MRSVLITNASEVVLPEREGRGIIRHPGWEVWIDRGFVAWVGPAGDRPTTPSDPEIIDADGGAVLPALVDAHTHLVFAGDRIEDFSARAHGATYAEIAARGGGILTTVKATRAATTGELIASARARLDARARYGIGTTEVKSGYGLVAEHELRMLEVIRALKDEGYDLEATLLAAHAVPRDVPREAYLASILDVMIPEAASRRLCRFVDVFVETGAYTIDEAKQIFARAREHGLIARLHADQLTAGGGAGLAAEVEAASADHLEHASDADLAAMARGNVVGVLLPAAMAFLGHSAKDLGARARAKNVELCVATDTNPGSSPIQNLPLCATLAVTTMGLHVEEAIRAITWGGARALRREDIGTLEVGALGRAIILDHADPRALIYAYGEPIIRRLVDATV